MADDASEPSIRQHILTFLGITFILAALNHDPLQRQTKREGYRTRLPALRRHRCAAGWARLEAGCDVRFHTQYGIKPQRGHCRHDANGSVIRWCFADLKIAEAFAEAFKR